MTSEERVMTLWADANPIRNAEVPELGETDATTYLAALTQRSSEMTQLKRQTEQQSTPPGPRSSVWKWATVAFAGLVAVGAVLLAIVSQGTSEVAQSDIRVIESLMEAWNSNDGEAIAAHFTEDGILDLRPGEGSIQEPWAGHTQIAEMTAGYSERHPWEASFDYTTVDDAIIFNRIVVQDAFTESGYISKPQGVSAVITDGKLEVLIVEIDSLHYCIGNTTTRCKVRETGEIRLSE